MPTKKKDESRQRRDLEPKAVISMSLDMKQSTEIIPKEQLDELRLLSGEGGSFQRSLSLEVISVDAKREIFITSQPDPKNDGEWLKVDMGPTFSGVLLRVRMRLNLTIGDGKTYSSWRTPEFDTFNETTILFGPNREKVMEGSPLTVKKQQFGLEGQEKKWLRLEYAVYVLIDQKIYRLFVHNSKSKAALKSFLKTRGDQPLPTFATRFSLVKDEESNIPSCVIKEQMERDATGNPVAVDISLSLQKNRELNMFIVGSKQMYAERNNPASVGMVDSEEAFSSSNPSRVHRGGDTEYVPSGFTPAKELVQNTNNDDQESMKGSKQNIFPSLGKTQEPPDFLKPAGVGKFPDYTSQKSEKDL